MSSLEQLDSLDDILNSPSEDAEPESPLVDWPADKIDPRLARSSYSSSLLFNGCPRKYQLQKLQTAPSKSSQEDWKRSLTFQFGHSVGEGIQETLVLGASTQAQKDKITLNLFTQWQCDLYDENVKQKKSFFHALNALHKFWALQDEGLYQDYEVAYFEGKPAAELSFRIWLPNGTSYRGYVDMVLVHKYSGEYVILELKTNSGRFINPAQYKNSDQAIGYSVVLNKIAPGITNYTVEYLVYMTYLQTWEPFSFPKTFVQRALWIKDRLWDAQVLELLVKQEGNYGMWPMRGNHCVNYNSPCEFLGICHMETESLVKPLREIDLEEDVEYQFEFTLEELL